MDGWIWFAIGIGFVYQHYFIRWTRDKILNSIHQSIEIGHTDLIIKSREKDYRQLFPLNWQFPAEVIFAENGIYIFRYIRLFRGVKIFVQYYCLYATEWDAIPFLAARFSSSRVIHKIDLLHIEGRNATVEFCHRVKSLINPKKVIHQYRFVLFNVRDNDAYRNLIRFQRYRYDILQSQKVHGTFPRRPTV